MCVHAKSFSHCPTLCKPSVIARQAPVSAGASRQEYWTGLLCPPLGYLSDPGLKPVSLMSPAWAGGFFTTNTTWEAPYWSVLMCDYMHFCGRHSSKCFDMCTPVSRPPQSRYKIPPSVPKISFFLPLMSTPWAADNNGSYSLLFWNFRQQDYAPWVIFPQLNTQQNV